MGGFDGSNQWQHFNTGHAWSPWDRNLDPTTSECPSASTRKNPGWGEQNLSLVSFDCILYCCPSWACLPGAVQNSVVCVWPTELTAKRTIDICQLFGKRTVTSAKVIDPVYYFQTMYMFRFRCCGAKDIHTWKFWEKRKKQHQKPNTCSHSRNSFWCDIMQ